MNSVRQKRAGLTSVLGRVSSPSIQRRAVHFLSKRVRLYGEMFIPPGRKTFPGVILCHGLGSDLRAVRASALALARRGIATLTFDFQGHGRSSGVCDSDLVRDVKAAFREFTKCSQIDSKNIALVGHSLGARTVLLAARELKGLKALVSLSCPPDDMSSSTSRRVLDSHHDLRGKENRVFEYPRDGRLPWLGPFQGTVSRLWMAVRGYRVRINWQKWIEAWGKARTLAAVREMRSSLPLLFVHCLGDRRTPYQASVELHEIAKGPKDLILLRGGFHSAPLLPGKVRSMWLDWLEAKLKPSEAVEDTTNCG